MPKQKVQDESLNNEQIQDLQLQLTQAIAKQQRYLADYQNLVRRTREEKATWAKMASQELIEELIVPLDHLDLAAQALRDPGLGMVIAQIWQVLEAHGLKKIVSLNQAFDPKMMEVVEHDQEKPQDQQVVTKIIRAGYSLHDQVIQHAKVVLG